MAASVEGPHPHKKYMAVDQITGSPQFKTAMESKISVAKDSS